MDTQLASIACFCPLKHFKQSQHNEAFKVGPWKGNNSLRCQSLAGCHCFVRRHFMLHWGRSMLTVWVRKCMLLHNQELSNLFRAMFCKHSAGNLVARSKRFGTIGYQPVENFHDGDFYDRLCANIWLGQSPHSLQWSSLMRRPLKQHRH